MSPTPTEPGCSQQRAALGLSYFRTCAICKLGPCHFPAEKTQPINSGGRDVEGVFRLKISQAPTAFYANLHEWESGKEIASISTTRSYPHSKPADMKPWTEKVQTIAGMHALVGGLPALIKAAEEWIAGRHTPLVWRESGDIEPGCIVWQAGARNGFIVDRVTATQAISGRVISFDIFADAPTIRPHGDPVLWMKWNRKNCQGVTRAISQHNRSPYAIYNPLP